MADISSPTNRRVVETVKLSRVSARRAARRVVLEGPHLLDEALESGLAPETVFVLDPADGASAATAGAQVLTVTERVMSKLATTQHPRGPVAVLETPASGPRPPGDALVLWEVRDPGNLGTALRSAVAFGVPVVIGPGCADLWNPKVSRAAAGAHFRGHIVERPELTAAELQAWDQPIVAAVPHGGVAPDALAEAPALMVVGAEGSGLPDDLLAVAAARVTIPMRGGIESLNVGVAASLLAYEIGRRNRGIGREVDD